jgi:hypothetical protein
MTSTAESPSDTGQQPQPDQSTSETPFHEVQRRLADQAPIWPVARAAALQNLRDIWADSKIKRKLDRAVAAKHLGVEDVLATDGNEEMPGDISIQGDTHNITHVYPAAAAASVPQLPASVAPAGPSKPWSKLWTAAAIAAALVGTPALGMGGAALYQYLFGQSQTIINNSDQLDVKPGISVSDTP